MVIKENSEDAKVIPNINIGKVKTNDVMLITKMLLCNRCEKWKRCTDTGLYMKYRGNIDCTLSGSRENMDSD